MKWLLLGVLALPLGLVALVAFAPERREIVRETTIAAAPAEVHALLEDLQRWGEWSPWRVLGDGSGPSFRGPRGVDGRAIWSGPDGAYILDVTASDPARGLWYDLTLIGGHDRGCGAEVFVAKGAFQYAAVAGGTRVLWSNAPRLLKLRERLLGFGLERWLGPELEVGLADLKRAVEARR